MILETRTHLTVNKDDREVYAEESKSDREQLMNLVRYFLGRFVDLDEMALPDISVEQRDLSVESHLLDQQGNVTNESESLRMQQPIRSPNRGEGSGYSAGYHERQPAENAVRHRRSKRACAPIAMDSSQPLILPVVSARAGAEDLKEKR
ncbi:hypothetical protein BLNAU_16112 [Blattamonas nauphoetae]|uniref:Uncharacterized protein n=1 Tax=Blattamonas nauphoetae TaxID=2049346 RepID=A0ABQ9XAP3_9EUKA|nr:hypothetical protein BLNAU_16112 [Blattamonas nauphoetae]